MEGGEMAGDTHPAQWLPDPTGEHEQRYWNGNRWTEHVADQGTTSTHALGEQPEPPAAPPVETTAATSGGLFAGMRRASEQRKAARLHARYETELAAWSRDEGELQTLVERARHFDGSPAIDTPLNLKRNERVFYVLPGAGLMETRSGPRHWQGGYSGFSFKVTNRIRYHVGGTRGTSVQGPDETKLLDTGTATITNQRIVFQGQKQSREWAFSKLLGYQHDEQSPWTPIQVSNRQKVSGIRYDANAAQAFQFNLALALATFNEKRDTFAAGLATELEQHRAQKPVQPVDAVSPAAAGATFSASSTSAGRPSGALAAYQRAPLWLRIALPIALVLIVVGAIGAVAGGGSSDSGTNANAQDAAPIITSATNPVPSSTSTTAVPTTLPPTTVPPTEPPTTAPPATAPPAPAPSETPAPAAQQVVTPGAFCSPVGATGVTSAGTPMVCSATSASGTPYTQPRWRSAWTY
jgi:Protein of unknown function (DUF2510)